MSFPIFFSDHLPLTTFEIGMRLYFLLSRIWLNWAQKAYVVRCTINSVYIHNNTQLWSGFVGNGEFGGGMAG